MPERERMLGAVQLCILALINQPYRRDTRGERLRPEIQALVHYPVSTPQVHTALRRMVQRGFLTCEMVPPTGKPGKRGNRHRLTPAGKDALESYRKIAEFIIEKSPNR